MPQAIKSDMTFLRDVVGAGLEGVGSAFKKTEGKPLWPATLDVVAPTVAGAAIGILSACLRGKRRSGLSLAVGGLVGSALGFAWASRGLSGAAARGAMRKVNDVRDARWLEKNPIAYA